MIRTFALLLLLSFLPACGQVVEFIQPDAAGDTVVVLETIRPDVSLDVAPDTTPDASPDATPDATPDTAPDTTPDMTPDMSPDAVALETAPDSSPELGVDASNPDAVMPDASACAMVPVVLGSAGNFAVIAGSTVTNTGPTSVTGDLGVSPGTAVTGFPPGTVIGAIHAGDPTAAQGIADLTTAYNEAAGRTLCAVTVAGNLGGQTLPPGLYKSTSSLAISSGDLTLDAKGDPNAVFIFQMASTLTTTSGRKIILSGGAKASNIFWQVGSSATLGTSSIFYGTIMADQSITLNTGAMLYGRALTRIAAVSLDSSAVVKP